MSFIDFADLSDRINTIKSVRALGRVAGNKGNLIQITGLSDVCRLGDGVMIRLRDGHMIRGETLRLGPGIVEVLPDGPSLGIALGDEVELETKSRFCPRESWMGRIIDADGLPLDGRPLGRGRDVFPMIAPPPPAAIRRSFGPRIETGFTIFNTILPLARGQRLGLFSGSGVG